MKCTNWRVMIQLSSGRVSTTRHVIAKNSEITWEATDGTKLVAFP